MADDGYNRGQIDLLCLKKLHVRESVFGAVEACKQVEKTIKQKREHMHRNTTATGGGAPAYMEAL